VLLPAGELLAELKTSNEFSLKLEQFGSPPQVSTNENMSCPLNRFHGLFESFGVANPTMKSKKLLPVAWYAFETTENAE
jgi:hypothetical protein